jgi:hypothetical protein
MSRAPSFDARRARAAVLEQVTDMLRADCAPRLSTLLYNPHMPEPQLAVLLAWADTLAAANPAVDPAVDPAAGLGLKDLEAALPALNVAFLASFTFAGAAARDRSLRGRKVDLELTDRGGGRLVERTRTYARFIAVARHGSAGTALVARTDRELRDAMDAISRAIARRH